MKRLLFGGVNPLAALLNFTRHRLNQSWRVVGMKTDAAGRIAIVLRYDSCLTGKL